MNSTDGWKWVKGTGWVQSGAPVATVRLTKKLLHECFNCGCPTREQAALMGLRHPLAAGWLDRLCGQEWAVEKYQRLASMRRPKGSSI